MVVVHCYTMWRQNIPELRVNAEDYHVQHKSHVHKCMYHTNTAIVLKDNNITNGGKALMIANVRVGHKEQFKKDTYKHVYGDEGNFTIPKIPENRLQRKGDINGLILILPGAKMRKM
eukprot:4369574-Ditylum_brightwellii.AAC.1